MGFLSNKTTLAKVTNLLNAFARILSYKITASLLLDEIPDSSSEHVIG